MAHRPTEITPKQKAYGLIGSIIWKWLSLLPLPLRWMVGDCIGQVLYHMMKSRRRIVLRNLELCFAEKTAAERKQLAIKTFKNAGKGVLSWGFALFASRRQIEGDINWQGRDTFQTFIRHHPVILLCPHFVTPMLTVRAIGMVTPLLLMYRPPRNPIFDMGYHCALTGTQASVTWVNRLYGKRDQHQISLIGSRENMRVIYQTLATGTPFLYLPDQNANRPKQATFAPFFGVQASTYTTLTRFARYNNARVMLCHMTMSTDSKKYEMRTELLPEDFISGDLLADAVKLNQLIEVLVREHPEQYFWLHRRFATRPAGEPPIY